MQLIEVLVVKLSDVNYYCAGEPIYCVFHPYNKLNVARRLNL